MRSALKVGFAVSVAVGAASCATSPPIITFNTRAELNKGSAIHRVLIFTDVESPAFRERINHGFQFGLNSRLSTCGIESKILQADPMDLDPGKRMVISQQTYQATAMLVIRAGGGSLITSSNGFAKGSMVFSMQVFDTLSNSVTWQARSIFDTSSSNLDDVTSGLQFATSIISRLRDDGLLHGCPPSAWPEVTPPMYCQDKREIILNAAARTSDPEQRTTLMRSLPVCSTLGP